MVDIVRQHMEALQILLALAQRRAGRILRARSSRPSYPVPGNLHGLQGRTFLDDGDRLARGAAPNKFDRRRRQQPAGPLGPFYCGLPGLIQADSQLGTLGRFGLYLTSLRR